MDSLNSNQKIITWLNSANGMSYVKITKILEYFNFNFIDLWDNFEAEKYNMNF
ncbi:MAG: hypothetical protein K0R07_40, partial [Sedimentibacter sp.]|nr:hypothetical protein [Sedimentibacter sp.]